MIISETIAQDYYYVLHVMTSEEFQKPISSMQSSIRILRMINFPSGSDGILSRNPMHPVSTAISLRALARQRILEVTASHIGFNSERGYRLIENG